MSVYSNLNIQTKIVRVAYHSNARTEFRFERDAPCLSNIRLMNIGCSQTGGTDVKYPISSGVGSLIKHISLYCGNQLISQLRDANKYLAFHYCNDSNDNELAKTNILAQNGLGYLTLANKLTRMGNQTNLTGDVSTTPVGWIRLDECLHFLKSTSQVPCDVGDWRLVIEWSSSLTNFNHQSGSYVAPTSIEIVEPMVVCDFILGAKSPSDLIVQYWDLESDRIVIPAIPPAVTTPDATKAKMNGFDTKTVGRMLLVNDMPEFPNAGLGIDKSVPQLDEKIQMTVNGKKKFAFDGITNLNKTQMLNDAWGAMCCPFFNNQYGLAGATDIYGVNTNMDGFSYGGVKMQQRIQDLQVEYTRTRGAENWHKEQFDLLIFGEVAKQFLHKGGKTVVVNA